MWILFFLLIAILMWIVCDVLLDKHNNTYNITWAAELLEKAVAFAGMYSRTVEIFFEKSDEIEGGYVIRLESLRLPDSQTAEETLAQSPLQWDICISNEDGTVTLRYESGCGYTGAWRHFQKAVLRHCAKQHPEWKNKDIIIRI